jgi:Zn-dependent peptidase ImmA (M78 family)
MLGRKEMEQLSNYRKSEIADLAEFIAEEYCPDCMVMPEVIADSSHISYNYGDYQNYFNGILEHDSGDFHIFLNTCSVQYPERLRFSFAHELGHYFIDDHRNSLKKGNSLHKSYSSLLPKNIVETEADCFASNLLAPPARFANFIHRKKFDFSVIESISKNFGISLSATLFRFVESGNYPIMVIYSKNNIVKFKWCSDSFPYKSLNCNSLQKVPINTVASEYFADKTTYNDAEIVFASDWFRSYEDIRKIQLYEKCIYPTFNDTVISIIWE